MNGKTQPLIAEIDAQLAGFQQAEAALVTAASASATTKRGGHESLRYAARLRPRPDSALARYPRWRAGAARSRNRSERVGAHLRLPRHDRSGIAVSYGCRVRG